MLANALQRYKNDKHPSEYLDLVEDNILWAGSRLLTPCVIKSYITSAIVKWEDTLGGKFTNALGRQYVYSNKLQIASIFKDDRILKDITESINTVPLTCGDSESPMSLESAVMPQKVSKSDKKIVQTKYPIPFSKDTEIIVDEDNESNGQVYLMHERCKKQGNNFPLISYMVPIREDQRILRPSSLTVKISNEKILDIEVIGHVLLRDT